jgi:PAS domain S-box-containing protein
MSLTEAQIQFAAEFVTVMVSVSALALISLRPPERTDHVAFLRAWCGLALLAIAAASFVRGSLLVTGSSTRWLGLATLAGAVMLMPALRLWWPAHPGRLVTGRRLLASGLLAWAAAGAAELVKTSGYVVDALLVAGAVLTGVAVLPLTRRAVVLRVATSTAITLLLVVLVLSVALSAVISSSVQRDELNRLAGRESIESATAGDSSAAANTAKYVGAILAAEGPLTAFASGDPAASAAAGAAIQERLTGLSRIEPNEDLAYTDEGGNRVISPAGARTVAAAAVRDPALKPTSCTTGKRGLFLAAGVAVVAASYPECASSGAKLGVVYSSVPLDGAYLAGRHSIDPAVSLALVSGPKVLASAGAAPSVAELSVAGRVAGQTGSAVTQAVGNQFISAGALPVAAGQAPLSLILATPATTVLSTRTQLYRALFLIALGGTVIALGLAVFTGDRITAGLRRLTTAAGRIRGGDSTMRAGIEGEDEVAVLGSAFDAMLDSLASQSSALQAAADSETRLRSRLQAVVAGMSDALVAVDAGGLITDFNRAAEELTGVPAGTALGGPARRVVGLRKEDGTAVEPLFFLPGQGGAGLLGSVWQPDGTDVPVAVSAGDLHGPDGELAGSVFVLRDLRREHEVEQMKTEFLSRVGHELRTPLTGIMGYAELLMRHDVPAARARMWCEEILQSARRLLRIVEMLEFFASSGAGRVVMRLEPIDVRALVNGVTSGWADRLPAGVTLGRRIARDTPAVAADRRWLALAVDELIDNAVKFSPEGGRIVVTAGRGAAGAGNGSGGDWVEIAVRDQGVGMSAEEYDVVFTDFAQADTSDTRRFGGLGLGLPIVRKVAEGHGGDVSCRSAPGQGTTLVIRLPASAVPPARKAAPGSPTHAGAGS